LIIVQPRAIALRVDKSTPLHLSSGVTRWLVGWLFLTGTPRVHEWFKVLAQWPNLGTDNPSMTALAYSYCTLYQKLLVTNGWLNFTMKWAPHIERRSVLDQNISKDVNESSLDPEPPSGVGLSVGGPTTSARVRLAALLASHPVFRPRDPPPPPPWGLSNLCETTRPHPPVCKIHCGDRGGKW
jgi:hypothetical protein